jgi:hypothetical protein
VSQRPDQHGRPLHQRHDVEQHHEHAKRHRDRNRTGTRAVVSLMPVSGFCSSISAHGWPLSGLRIYVRAVSLIAKEVFAFFMAIRFASSRVSSSTHLQNRHTQVLSGTVLHDKAGFQFIDCPGCREAAGRGHWLENFEGLQLLQRNEA